MDLFYMEKNNHNYVIYITRNTLTNQIYIGVHKQSSKNFEGYLGSGDRLLNSVNKYGKSNFEFEVLHCYEFKKDAYIKESELVTREFIEREDTLNVRLGGDGGWEWINGEAKFMNPIKIKVNKNGKKVFYYPCHSEESRNKAKETCVSKYGSAMGMCHTPEAREKNKTTKILRYGSQVGMIHNSEVRIKAQLSRKLSQESKGIPLDYYLNNDNSKIKRRLTRDKTAISKDKRLLEIIDLVDSKDELIKTGSVLDICKFLFTERNAIKYRGKIYNSLDNNKVIKVNNLIYLAKISSTTRA